MAGRARTRAEVMRAVEARSAVPLRLAGTSPEAPFVRGEVVVV